MRVGLLLEFADPKAGAPHSPGRGSHSCSGGCARVPTRPRLRSLPASFSGSLTALSASLAPAWSREETRCSSSEDDTDMDVEGLRRRRGREPSAPQPVGTLGLEDQARGEGAGWELGISLNLCLLGALVLLGLGIFLCSGEWHLPCWGPACYTAAPPLAPYPVLCGPHHTALSPSQVVCWSGTVVSGDGAWLVPAGP